MISLLHESIATLRRMRWLVLALVIALPLSSTLQMASTRFSRLAPHRERSARPMMSIPSALVIGFRSCVGLYHDMGLGNATFLCALFVLVRPRWVHSWLRVNANVGKRLALTFWTILVCAALTLLQRWLTKSLLQVAPHWGMGSVFFGTTTALLESWFGACVAAFWQVILYPLILQEPTESRTTSSVLRPGATTTWSSLRIFNFVLIGAVFLLVIPLVSFISRHRIQIYDMPETSGLASAVVRFPFILVPFGVVVHKLSIVHAIIWGFRSMIACFEFLLVIIIPLTLAFALVAWGGSWLGSLTGLPELVKVGAQPLNGLLAASGLVAGALYFKRIPASEASNT
jgi:hypothetical protein